MKQWLIGIYGIIAAFCVAFLTCAVVLGILQLFALPPAALVVLLAFIVIPWVIGGAMVE